MPVKQVDLTAKQARFISNEIKSGRYRNEDEVLQAGIVLLERKKQRNLEKYEKLVAMIQAGIADAEAGRVTKLTTAAEIKAHGKRLVQQVIGKNRNA